MRVELGRTEAADEDLQWAIEEFRKRKLDAIDAHQRELGVDPTAQDSAARRLWSAIAGEGPSFGAAPSFMPPARAAPP
jgi:hypothetical protein